MEGGSGRPPVLPGLNPWSFLLPSHPRPLPLSLPSSLSAFTHRSLRGSSRDRPPRDRERVTEIRGVADQINNSAPSTPAERGPCCFVPSASGSEPPRIVARPRPQGTSDPSRGQSRSRNRRSKRKRRLRWPSSRRRRRSRWRGRRVPLGDPLGPVSLAPADSPDSWPTPRRPAPHPYTPRARSEPHPTHPRPLTSRRRLHPLWPGHRLPPESRLLLARYKPLEKSLLPNPHPAGMDPRNGSDHILFFSSQ